MQYLSPSASRKTLCPMWHCVLKVVDQVQGLLNCDAPSSAQAGDFECILVLCMLGSEVPLDGLCEAYLLCWTAAIGRLIEAGSASSCQHDLLQLLLEPIISPSRNALALWDSEAPAQCMMKQYRTS